MKKTKMITFAVMAATAAITFAGCSSGETEETKASADSTESVTDQNTTGESVTSEGASAGASGEKYDVSGVDFTNPDIVIKYGDFDAMKKLASDVSEGKMEGKVIEAEGYYSDNIGHSIMERNADNTGGVGFRFEVVDMVDDEYPEHESKIKITGVVKDTGEEAAGFKIYTIVVPKENFKVL